MSKNREDKIQFIKDGPSKESLDNILETFEAHPCGLVQRELLSLWAQFQKEHSCYSLENLTQNNPVCQFIRKLDGKHIPDSYKEFKSFLDVKPEEDVSHNQNYCIYMLSFFNLCFHS